MKVKFTCKRSGNTVTFDREGDIATMRKEPGYIEVERSEVGQSEQVNPVPQPKENKRGRPKKVSDNGII